MEGNLDLDVVPSKRVRANAAGRKPKAVGVQQSFEWFIDVRDVLTGRLPLKPFITKAMELYNAWLKQQTEPVLPEEQLQFCKCWIRGWMKEYGFSSLIS